MSYIEKTNWANPNNYGGKRTLNKDSFIVIHYTANDGDHDESNGNYFHNNKVGASAHDFVDSDSVTHSVPYDNYPITSEAMVQSLIQAYLRGAGFDVLSEVHEAKGRADLVVNTGNRRIVFEFKYAQNETEAKAKLSEAVEQIKSRDYGNILPKKNELLRIAAVFNAEPKVRAFSQYQLVV